MAKRYDPIMCMMVDEPTKAQDAMPSDLKKAGYEVGTVEKYGSTYYTLVYNGKVISTSPTEANIVEKAKKHYANRHDKAQDELSLAQKKQVVTELKGYLKKSYNFSDESEYARAYEDLRHMFTTGSRKSISGLFENTVKKTGARDSASALDKAIRICDASTGHKVVVFVENYLRSIGKNNSTGKYDKIVQGVRSLLSQSLLDDEGLKKAAEHEADRLLKKYNL